MSKVIVSVVLIVVVAGVFQVMTTAQQDVRPDAVAEQSVPGPLTRFERSLLAWGQVQRAVAEPSPMTRFERSLLRWGQVQPATVEPSPLTRFEQSLLRWAQMQSE